MFPHPRTVPTWSIGADGSFVGLTAFGLLLSELLGVLVRSAEMTDD